LDRATLALIVGLLALSVSIARWVYDFLLRSSNTAKSKKSKIHIGLLEEQTNCFITRSGHLLFLISLRIYNDSDQIPATISNYRCQARIQRHWRTPELYNAPQANIFPSLIRNSLPVTIAPEERQDFYEVFALDEIIPGIEIKMRFDIQTSTGKTIQHRFRLRHRTDKRPVFDLLFRMLE